METYEFCHHVGHIRIPPSLANRNTRKINEEFIHLARQCRDLNIPTSKISQLLTSHEEGYGRYQTDQLKYRLSKDIANNTFIEFGNK